MKKTSVLVLALICTLVACNKTGTKKGDIKARNEQREASVQKVEKSLKIACVDLDSLQEHYKYYKEVQEQLDKEEKSAEATISQKTKALTQKVQSLQTRAQKGQLTQEQYEKEALALQKEEANLAKLHDKLSMQLQDKLTKKQKDVMTTINTKMKEYAEDKGYDFIVVKNNLVTTMLYVNDKYDVTKEVIEILNKDYKK